MRICIEGAGIGGCAAAFSKEAVAKLEQQAL
jgi:hypothetical protein